MSTNTASIDVKAFIDQRGIAPRQWLLVILCFLIVAADGMDVAIMGFLAPSIIAEWGISRSEFGLVMSAAPVGLVVGALLAGPSSDYLGRKTVLLASVFAFGTLCVLTAFADSVTSMVALRFLTGIGLGAAMPNTTTLLAEYVPERRRSLLITVMFIGFGVGSAVVGFAAGWMIPAFGWRSVLLLGGVFPLLLLPLLWLFLPESVRFMLVRNHPAERIAKTLGQVCRTRFAPGTTFFAPEPPVQAKKPMGVLFSDGYTLTTLCLWVTYFMGLLVIYLITGWLPTLMKDAGLSITQAANITAMFQTGGILGAVLTGWAMDKLKPTLVIAAAYLGGALCVLGVGSAGATASSLPLWMAAAGFFMNGAQTGLNAFAPACYPTVARATGVSWMQGMGRFGSILGSAIGGVLLGMGWGFAGIVSALALPAAIAAVAMITNYIGARPARATAKAVASS